MANENKKVNKKREISPDKVYELDISISTLKHVGLLVKYLNWSSEMINKNEFFFLDYYICKRP